jgi:heme-binding protein
MPSPFLATESLIAAQNLISGELPSWTILARVGAVVRSGEMPPTRYTAIHGSAKLSSVERGQVYDWGMLNDGA